MALSRHPQITFISHSRLMEAEIIHQYTSVYPISDRNMTKYKVQQCMGSYIVTGVMESFVWEYIILFIYKSHILAIHLAIHFREKDKPCSSTCVLGDSNLWCLTYSVRCLVDCASWGYMFSLTKKFISMMDLVPSPPVRTQSCMVTPFVLECSHWVSWQMRHWNECTISGYNL